MGLLSERSAPRIQDCEALFMLLIDLAYIAFCPAYVSCFEVLDIHLASIAFVSGLFFMFRSVGYSPCLSGFCIWPIFHVSKCRIFTFFVLLM